MRRLGPHQIDTSEATATNDTLRFDPATSRLEWGSGRPTRALVPLTTSVGGVPGDVWDSNDERTLTEVVL